jgi:hypothetical protein
MEFFKEIWGEIKEFAGIYSITTKWKIEIPQDELSNFINIELDNRYSDIKSLFKHGLKREKWINLLQLNYHNKRYRLIHKRYVDSLLKDIDSNNGSERNFCPIFIFMNYVYSNIDDFRHQRWFMIIYHAKVYSLIDFYTTENEGGRYDMLIHLLNDIRVIL